MGQNLSKSTYLKTAFTDPTSDNMDRLIGYFQNIGGKKLTISCRRQNAFRTHWTKREENLRDRCHVQNAVEYLNAIRDFHSKGQIQIIIADIARHVKNLDTTEDISFILSSTNTLPSAIHFDIANSLFLAHQIKEQHQNNYSIDLLTIYSIRLSLESRIKGLLGIDSATHRGKPVGLNELIKLSKELKAVKYSKAVNWSEIEWMNEWINHHMHRTLRPYPWIIYQAFESLKSFLAPKDPVTIGGRTIYSLYSGTYVIDENDLHKEIESALKNRFSDVEIGWLPNREILQP